MKIYPIIFLCLFIIPLVSADSSYAFKQGDNQNFNFVCLDSSNQYCNSATIVLLNVWLPNGTIAPNFINRSMTYSLTSFNSSLPTYAIGTHRVLIFSPSAINTTSEFSYEVTTTGIQNTGSETATYLGALALLLILFGLSLYGSFKIEAKNQTNSEGDVINVNWSKYGKGVCIVLSYIFLAWISFIAWNISFAFLHLGAIASAFYWIYRILIGFTIPFLVLMIFIGVSRFIKDREFHRKLSEGYYYGWQNQ